MKSNMSARFLQLAHHFMSLSNLKADISQSGLEQFYEKQSHGVEPSQPDPFYRCLENGKQWFDWTVDEIRKSYGTNDWFGWDHFFRTIPRWLWRSMFGWSPNGIKTMEDLANESTAKTKA